MNKNTEKVRPAQPRPMTKKRCERKHINASSTQISSFHDEERKGQISKRQSEILGIIEQHGATTCREAATILNTFPSNLTAAFKGLEDAGKIVVRSEKDSPITGKRVMLYELAGGTDD